MAWKVRNRVKIADMLKWWNEKVNPVKHPTRDFYDEEIREAVELATAEDRTGTDALEYGIRRALEAGFALGYKEAKKHQSEERAIRSYGYYKWS